MNKFFFLFFLFHMYSYAQDKAMVPKTGTVAFIKKQSITDSAAYKKSTGVLSQKLLEHLKAKIKNKDLEQELAMYEKEETGFNGNLYLELYSGIEGIYRYYHTFDKDKIYYHCTLDDYLLNDTITYTISQNQLRNIDSNDTTSGIHIIGIKEFRDVTKIISGYPCFKVDFSYKQVIDENELDSFMNNLIQRKELWVTEKISVPIHPAIQIAEIMKKYYPLEIIETIDDVKGFKIIYELEEFSIAN